MSSAQPIGKSIFAAGYMDTAPDRNSLTSHGHPCNSIYREFTKLPSE
jgi:hypothetical protein